MVSEISKYLVFQILILKVLTTSAQHSIKQYLHVTGVGPHAHSAGLANLPNVGLATRPAVPSTGLSSLSALALPALISSLAAAQQQQQQQQPQLLPTVLPTLKTQPAIPPSAPTSKTNCPATNTQNGLDSSVLNNLAIALQLLIVSNILNAPATENEANPIYEMLETVKNIPVSLTPTVNNQIPTHVVSEPSYLSNANFVGSSGFAEATVIDPYTKSNTRNNYALMSPYEALGPNSPFSDPILNSPYGSVMSSKKDFHSPYAMMDSDLFSIN